MDRELIINRYSKNEFMQFLEYDYEGKILELFNDEGIEILNKSSLKEERICYILTYSNYKNELLKNVSFLNALLNSDTSRYYASLHSLDYDTYDFVLSYILKLNESPNIIAKFFTYLDNDYKIKAIDKFDFSEELLYEIIKYGEYSVVNKIINKYNIDLTKYNIDIHSFFNNAKESYFNSRKKKITDNIDIDYINIPTKMINKKLAISMWNNYDIFKVRAVINDMEYCTDSSLINDYVKKNEEDIIANYTENSMLSPFKEIYDLFLKYKKSELKCFDEDFYENRNEYFNFLNKIKDLTYYDKLNYLYEIGSIEKVEEYLKHLSDNLISNYIIDYHFEENYHNIMFDMSELLNFYYKGNIVLQEERVELYYKITNIDYLTVNEKQELYNNLKNIDIMSMFYDDMKIARTIVSESIKEYSLSSESVKKYKDEKLSKEYGVDVYTFKGQSFFGIVKSGRRLYNEYPEGHSFSLIGDAGLVVFGEVEDSNTFFYDSDGINPEQLIHAFPNDSFTSYKPFEYSKNATDRVNVLATADELLNETITYNELLFLERGIKSTDIDKTIPELKRIALYCLDEIRGQDIKQAKNNNVGIILVNSNDYKYKKEKEFNPYRHDINVYNYNYFNGSSEKDKYESSRR